MNRSTQQEKFFSGYSDSKRFTAMTNKAHWLRYTYGTSG
ncbi:hypothetical protein yfred0001_6010 [Yersinia frederiksenii ATCC 33641]|nr:hypothetical protein yfred0001_6010 [Yersinia frederiksenii ATCC 33641]